MNTVVRSAFSIVLLFSLVVATDVQAVTPIDGNELVKKIQSELSGPITEDGKPNANVPHGEWLHGVITDSKIYPGTENQFQVYVPAQYDGIHPACLLLKLDGFGGNEATVLDNLIARHELPVIIGVGISPGAVLDSQSQESKPHALRFNRSYEFDSVNDHFPNFVLNELLPAVQKLTTSNGRAIHLSPEGSAHAVTGGSTGGIGSFTLAWQRPDQFTRVYSLIGTFVSMRGGNDYPMLIRKTEPKGIRIFLEDGSTDAWNPLFGSWYDANLNMESALTFAGYDVAHAWGTHGHDGRPGQVIFPDVMRWLLRDFPNGVQAGVSQNSTLEAILVPGEGWRTVASSLKNAGALTANKEGVVFFADAGENAIYRLDSENKPAVFFKGDGISGGAFGPDGNLYVLVPKKRLLIRLDPQGTSHVIADEIAGKSIVVTDGGVAYVSEPGLHSDVPSRIWRISPDHGKQVVDEGLASASGVAFSPDHTLFFAAEYSTKWIYSYVLKPDGALTDKQAFYWLHMTDVPNDSGAEDLATDTHGNLYVATRMGVQVCDRNGRVRAILPLPQPSGPIRSLCFGGENFSYLYVTDGNSLFKRKLNLPGVPPWSTPVSVPSQGPA